MKKLFWEIWLHVADKKQLSWLVYISWNADVSVATTIIEYDCEEEKDSEVESRAAVVVFQANLFKIMYCFTRIQQFITNFYHNVIL